jgi:hypothetical protein
VGSRRMALLKLYRTDFRGVAGSSGTTYGYTLTVRPTGTIFMGAYGPPEPAPGVHLHGDLVYPLQADEPVGDEQ